MSHTHPYHRVLQISFSQIYSLSKAKSKQGITEQASKIGRLTLHNFALSTGKHQKEGPAQGIQLRWKKMNLFLAPVGATLLWPTGNYAAGNMIQVFREQSGLSPSVFPRGTRWILIPGRVSSRRGVLMNIVEKGFYCSDVFYQVCCTAEWLVFFWVGIYHPDTIDFIASRASFI